jgi:CMP-N,N'-diacetyllegionaminic acid synthase
MPTDKKILGLVLARGGSKGIPKKNIKPLAGNPLISWIIKEALKSELEEVYVSSDSKEILKVAAGYGASILLRPEELAQDDTPSIKAVQHFLKMVKCDAVCLLNACTPFNKTIFINEAIKLFLEKEADSVVSLVESFDSHPSKLCKLNDDNLIVPLDKFRTAERQKLDKIYKRNTCIYISKSDIIMSGELFGNKTYGYIMPQENSLDINTPHDFLIAELYMKYLKNT